MGALLCVGCDPIVPVMNEPPDPRPSTSTAPVIEASEVIARDGGPIDYAVGSATQTSEGVYAYVVSAGGTPNAIGIRFGVCTMDVLISNPQQDPFLIPEQTITVSRVTSTPIDSIDCRMDVNQAPWR